MASFGEFLTKLGEFRPVYGKSVRVLSIFLRVLGEFLARSWRVVGKFLARLDQFLTMLASFSQVWPVFGKFQRVLARFLRVSSEFLVSLV